MALSGQALFVDQAHEASCLDVGLGELWDLQLWMACPQLSMSGAPLTLSDTSASWAGLFWGLLGCWRC